MRGYFAIGIEQGKFEVNLGTLMRSAYNFGASFIFTVGKRYTRQASDTVDAINQMPYYKYDSIKQVLNPDNCPVIGIEITSNAIDLPNFSHPERAIYLLGSENKGLSKEALEICDSIVKIPGAKYCLNVSVAGSIIMYDRISKQK